MEEQLNDHLDRLVALRAEAALPRRDRTYFTNLEISRGGALDQLVGWEALLAGPDAEVIAMLTREDQHGAEMRVSSPFAGVLTDAERRIALERAWAQLADERSK